MADINDKDQISKLDPKNVYGSTRMFIDQCRQIHDIAEKLEFSKNSTEDLKNFDSIIFSGMGGSAYGGHVAASSYKDELPLPFYVNSDYGLPAFAGSKTIVLLTSYSGGTEETLSSFEKAKKIGAKSVALTSGGKLAEGLTENDLGLVFNPTHNPSGQPRLGTGYIVLGTIEILRKLGLVSLTSDEITSAIDELEGKIDEIENDAKELAGKIYGNIPLIFAGSIFEGNAHILRNQFNETAKSFSSFHFLPEANHHVMEGLKNPTDRKLVGLFIESSLYDEKISKRMELTKDVFNKNSTSVLSYKLKTTSKLAQILEMLALGGFLTFYDAILYDQDPSLIPWVDYFKEKLSK